MVYIQKQSILWMSFPSWVPNNIEKKMLPGEKVFRVAFSSALEPDIDSWFRKIEWPSTSTTWWYVTTRREFVDFFRKIERERKETLMMEIETSDEDFYINVRVWSVDELQREPAGDGHGDLYFGKNVWKST